MYYILHYIVYNLVALHGVSLVFGPPSSMQANLSRSFLIQWLASLGVNIKRVEEFGTGAALCECLKQLDPSFPKFKESPKTEWEYLANLKQAKEYFNNKNVRICFPIDRMCKLKLQDNLEFLQWFYKYYEESTRNKEEEQADEYIRITAVESKEANNNTNIQNNNTNIQNNKTNIQMERYARIFENERDFYFSKLVLIEELVKNSDEISESFRNELLRIMYEEEYTSEHI